MFIAFSSGILELTLFLFSKENYVIIFDWLYKKCYNNDKTLIILLLLHKCCDNDKALITDEYYSFLIVIAYVAKELELSSENIIILVGFTLPCKSKVDWNLTIFRMFECLLDCWIMWCLQAFEENLIPTMFGGREFYDLSWGVD